MLSVNDTIIYYLGLFGPVILMITTGLLLRNQPKYLTYFAIGFVFNNLLNIGLKLLLKEPRPNDRRHANQIGLIHGLQISYNEFGMPSGHAQNCGFMLILITYMFNNPYLTCFYLIITSITLYQRYITEMHSVTQLIAGLFIGLSVGYVVYHVSKNQITGNIRMKLDDAFRPK